MTGVKLLLAAIVLMQISQSVSAHTDAGIAIKMIVFFQSLSFALAGLLL